MPTSTELGEIPFLRNIGLVMTYKCQVACPHCIIEAGPHRKEEISLTDAYDWIRQIAAYRSGYIKVLSLTGGEPFYDIDNLKRIADFADSLGLIVSAVTNAFWASTEKEAINILKKIPSIKLLAISTDEYHQESIPLERVKNAISAARKIGTPYNVYVCTENVDDEVYLEILKKLEEITEKDTITTAITFPAGRALTKIRMENYRLTKETPISACSSANFPIIFLDGRVIACIGPIIDLPYSHPLILGNLKKSSLNEILDRAELNPILHAIRIWGPKKLISIIKDAGLANYLPQKYITDSACNACYNLMSDNNIIEFLNKLSTDLEFNRIVAYARVYYLKETKMAELGYQ